MVLAVYLLFSVACFFTVHEHLRRIAIGKPTVSNGQKKNIDRVQMRLLFYSFHKNRGSLLANITEMVDL